MIFRLPRSLFGKLLVGQIVIVLVVAVASSWCCC